jgi:hypothetical protein
MSPQEYVGFLIEVMGWSPIKAAKRRLVRQR